MVGSSGCMMRGKTVNMEVKMALQDSTIILPLAYGSETGHSTRGNGENEAIWEVPVV